MLKNEPGELLRRIADLEKLETEHRRTIEILRASENKYRLLLENLPQKIFYKDKNSVYISCNNNYAHDLKTQPDEIIGKKDYDFYEKELAEKYREDDKRIMESGKTEYLEEKYIQNGQEVVVQTVKTPLEDEKGNRIGILGIFWDITERKGVEEELRAAHKRFKDVLNSVDSLVYAVDMKTYEVLFINKFGRDNWGEIEGKICWQTLQKGQSGPCEFCTNEKLIGPDGKPLETFVWEIQNTSNKRWYECRDRAIYWPDGRLVRIEIATDITERKQMEEALKESEERYRTIIEFSNDMIWILDTDGLYQFVNKRCEEFSGLKQDYFLGKSFIPFIDKKDLPKVIDCFHKALKGEPQQYDALVKKEDGSKYFLLVNTAPIYSKEKVVGTVSFGRDITERKKAEEQIKESLKQKLKRSDRQNKLLSYLIEGTRGGKTRALILRHLAEKSYNANQLAKTLGIEYKTIRHHLEVLVKHGMIMRKHNGYPDLYFISDNVVESLSAFDDKK